MNTFNTLFIAPFKYHSNGQHKTPSFMIACVLSYTDNFKYLTIEHTPDNTDKLFGKIFREFHKKYGKDPDLIVSHSSTILTEVVRKHYPIIPHQHCIFDKFSTSFKYIPSKHLPFYRDALRHLLKAKTLWEHQTIYDLVLKYSEDLSFTLRSVFSLHAKYLITYFSYDKSFHRYIKTAHLVKDFSDFMHETAKDHLVYTSESDILSTYHWAGIEASKSYVLPTVYQT